MSAFDIDLFHVSIYFRIILETFPIETKLNQQFPKYFWTSKPTQTAISKQSKPTQAAIFEDFFDFEAKSNSHFQFELDLNWNWIELSLTLLLLLSRQRAREASAFIKNKKRRRL